VADVDPQVHRLWASEKMATTVAVQSAKQAVVPDHFPQRPHHCSRRFFLHPLRVTDLTGWLRPESPADCTSCRPETSDSNHRQCAAASLVMAAVSAPAAQGPHRFRFSALVGPPQRLLHPSGTDLNLTFTRFLVKMPDVQIGISAPDKAPTLSLPAPLGRDGSPACLTDGHRESQPGVAALTSL
jgi:hypothetical protein